MKSINTKLAATFIAIFLLVITAISSILIIISTTTTKDLTLSGARYRVELQAKSLDQAFSNRAIVLESFAEVIMKMDTVDQDVIQSMLAPIYEANEDYNLYVGFPNNLAIFSDYWEPDSSWVATERDWYAAGASNPGVVASTVPYVDEMSGEICFTMVYGMMKDGKLLGVMALDVYTDSLLGVMQDESHAISGQHSLLIDKAGNIYYHPDEAFTPSIEKGFQNLNDIDSRRFAPIFNAQGKQGDLILTGLTGQKSYFIPVDIEGTDWIVCGVISVAALDKQMLNQILLTVLLGGISLLLASFIIIYIVKKMITVPITHMVEAARVMATGDLDITTNTDTNDELGEFGRAFQAIINDTQASVKTIQAVADGDLTQNIQIRSEKDVMGSALSDMLDKNNTVMSEILRASGMVSNCSRQIANISQTLAGGASAQSEAVERLSASISQISEITQQNMKQSVDTSNLGDEIIKDAEHGGAQMADMLKAVKEIDEASRSIGHVIKTIDDIAFQTNILALNAAVEAARAGQHGKGFAVVAEEVRNLATKSAEAAKNTGELISDSIEKADFGSQLASQTAVSFENIVSKLTLSVQKIKEISDYSERQVHAIQSVDNELQSVSQVAQQNSASAEEAAAAATEMNGQSSMLEKSVSQFNLRSGRGAGFPQA